MKSYHKERRKLGLRIMFWLSRYLVGNVSLALGRELDTLATSLAVLDLDDERTDG